MLGEAPLIAALVPQRAALARDEEVTAAARLQLDVGIRVRRKDRGGQTGRLGLVVSNNAVLDADVHADGVARNRPASKPTDEPADRTDSGHATRRGPPPACSSMKPGSTPNLAV